MKENPETGGCGGHTNSSTRESEAGGFLQERSGLYKQAQGSLDSTGSPVSRETKIPLNKIEIEQRKVLTTCKFIDILTIIVLINHETNNPRGKWARDTGVGEKHTRQISTTETKTLEFL